MNALRAGQNDLRVEMHPQLDMQIKNHKTTTSSPLQFRWEATNAEHDRAEQLPWVNEMTRDRLGNKVLLERKAPELWLLKEVIVSDKDVASVEVQPASIGSDYTVSLQFKEEAKERFAKMTAQSVGRKLAIVVNGNVVSAPVVREAIKGGKVSITGGFNKEEAKALASAIKSVNPAVSSGPAGPSFGPVHELVVNHMGENCLIDFDTGHLFTSPTVKGPEEGMKWAADHGIDAGGGNQPTVRGLIGMDLIVDPRQNTSWDATNAQSLLASDIFRVGKPGNPTYLSAKGDLPVTYAFKTREGGIGILQILGFIEQEPRGVSREGYYMIDETASSKNFMSWHDNDDSRPEAGKPLVADKLERLLKNLARQTGLEFKRENRTVDVWVAVIFQVDGKC